MTVALTVSFKLKVFNIYMMHRQIRVKKLIVQLNALLYVTQSKFNQYKRLIVCRA